jgi:hypothetical protein
MKFKSILLTALVIISLTSNSLSGQESNDFPILIDAKFNFSNETIPSEKELKAKIKSATNDEIIEYSFHLVKFLVREIEKNPNEGAKYFITSCKIVNEHIIPSALAGDINSLNFVDSFQRILYAFDAYDYYKSSKELVIIRNYNLYSIKLIPKNALEKYYLFQRRLSYSHELSNSYTEYLFSYDEKHTYNRNVNKHEQELMEYFKTFNKERLIEIREIISTNYNKMKKMRVTDGQQSIPFFPCEINQSNINDIKENDFQCNFVVTKDRDGHCNVFVKSLIGGEVQVSADDYLFILRSTIDMLLIDENPVSLFQLLYSYVNKEISPLEFNKDYTKSKNQFFEDDLYGSIIYCLLSGIIINDWKVNTLNKKTYYLNKSIEVGGKVAYYNLANLYWYYSIASSNSKYDDTCRYYIDKGIENNVADAFTFKGVRLFNGDGYVQNKEKGMELIKKGYALDGLFAKKLLKELPKSIYREHVSESYYWKQGVEINQPWDIFFKSNEPWDFKVRCSNCSTYCYPKEIIFGKSYDSEESMPNIKSTELYIDYTGNSVLGANWNDFRRTLTIAMFGRKMWKHVMCSPLCQQEYENKNNANWNAVKNKRIAFDNEIIKCESCSKTMKRMDMKSITDCPCWDGNGNNINISFTQSYDIYGDSEPKLCSDDCVINFCKVKCGGKGYRSKY